MDKGEKKPNWLVEILDRKDPTLTDRDINFAIEHNEAFLKWCAQLTEKN